MVLQAKALILGLGAAAALAAGFASSAAASEEGGAPQPSSGGKKATSSSKGKKTPSGVDPGHLADQTTDALVHQDIAKLRDLVKQWAAAGDTLTSAALSEDLEEAVKGTKIEEWQADGDKGSPLLRAFGERVLLVEGRPEKLLLWSDAWKSVLPVLAQALKTKADAIDVDPKKGSTDDPMPDAATLQRVIDAMNKGDPTLMRTVADQVEKAGFPDVAADLRAAADLIESGKAKVPDAKKPAPAPDPEPHEPQPGPHDVKPAPAPSPAPTPKPAGGPGRIVIVKKGEGPFQVTERLLGKGQGGRFGELVKENVPPKKKDPKTGGFTNLQPGEKLKVPAAWPASPYAVHETGLAPSPSPVPAPTGERYVVVQKGEGPWAIAKRVWGSDVDANAHWKELVAANVPPKKKDSKTGNFTTLGVGERLKVPANWPTNAQIVVAGDDEGIYEPPVTRLDPGGTVTVGAEMSERQTKAGQIALSAHLGKLDPDLLKEWQAREGIPATGQYDPACAYVLCFRFGIVPPVPMFGGAQSLKKFVQQMQGAARKDPQRRDEYMARAREAMKKAAA
jgi:hypothetical protein